MKKFTIPTGYRSSLISSIKRIRRDQDKLKKDFTPTTLQLGSMNVHLARHFGFCYGVENAIEIAFRTVEENPGKRIFLLGEMIHNPFVNDDLLAKGVKFLTDTKGNELVPFSELNAEDIVIIPAFGTTIETEQRLKSIGIQVEKYNTTCPFVEKVWNRAEQIAAKGYSIVVHGKPSHEETRATFSHSDAHTPTIVINDMEEAIVLGEFIKGSRPMEDFYETFKGRYSKGFDAEKDLVRLGVVNQTTMLATDTQAIADHLKKVVMERYHLSEENAHKHVADTRDTLCYATNDNQMAVRGMLEQPADFAIVIGGRKSSNSSHLVELCEEKLPTYFIQSAKDILSSEQIISYLWRTHEEVTVDGFLPQKDQIDILITSGASCPDALVEEVIEKLSQLVSGAHALDTVRQEWSV